MEVCPAVNEAEDDENRRGVDEANEGDGVQETCHQHVFHSEVNNNEVYAGGRHRADKAPDQKDVHPAKGVELRHPARGHVHERAQTEKEREHDIESVERHLELEQKRGSDEEQHNVDRQHVAIEADPAPTHHTEVEAHDLVRRDRIRCHNVRRWVP